MSRIDSMAWRQALLKGALLFVASYSFAVYLNVATNVWRLIELLPPSVVNSAGTFLLFVSAPFQPVGVHEQEEFLELLLVWFFSAPVSVSVIIGVYIAVHRSRRFFAYGKHESAGRL